ncbi:MAG: CPBP family intramembrane metalloprotease [Butyrivibrio sp.]|nr:CPBP family intramembrane metalloprotease [Butyrivibrio sp.]
MNKKINKKELAKLLLLFVGALLIEIIVTGIIVIFMSLNGAGIGIISMVTNPIGYMVIIAILIWYSKRHGENLWKECRFKKIKMSTVFLSVLLGIVFRPMVLFVSNLSKLFVPDVSAQLLDSLLGESVLLYFIIIAILAPVCEEIIMRGFFHNKFVKVLPFAGAAILSGFCFGVFHMNLNQFCFAWIAGILLAYVYRASGSIYAPIVVHLVNNGISSIKMFFGNMKYKEQGISLAEASEIQRGDMAYMTRILLIYGVLSIAALFLTRIIIRKIAQNEGTENQGNNT